jgi:hypothetical protein
MFGPTGLWKGRDDISDMMLFHSDATKNAKDKWNTKPLTMDEQHEALYDANPERDVHSMKMHRCLMEHSYRLRRLTADSHVWSETAGLRKKLGEEEKDANLILAKLGDAAKKDDKKPKKGIALLFGSAKPKTRAASASPGARVSFGGRDDDARKSESSGSRPHTRESRVSVDSSASDNDRGALNQGGGNT